MKRKDKIFIYAVTGLMFLSAFAATLSFFVSGSGNNSQETTVQDTNAQDTTDTTSTNSSSIVEGVEWPIVLEAPVTDLVIDDLVEGTGDVVKVGDVIVANYRLAQADGTPVAGNDTFESGQPFTATLDANNLIQGWVEGIPGMKVGGLRRLKVPANMAYGDGDLVFDVQVLVVNPQ